MNFLVQIESGLSLTGCNADKRIQIKPSQEYAVLLNIYRDILSDVQNREISVPPAPVDVGWISKKLLSSRGASLVISGSNVREIQLLVNEINITLGNIGKTILFTSYLRTHEAIDSDMDKLVRRMNEGKVGALISWNVNPAYTWYNRDEFIKGLRNVGLTVSLSSSPDETTELVQYVCPDNHYLESWNDAEPKKDFFSLMQPVINPLFDTRQMAETLLKWSGSSLSFYDFIRNYWAEQMMPLQTEFSDPVLFFDKTVEKGVFEPAGKAKLTGPMETAGQTGAFSSLKPEEINDAGKSTVEIVLYEPVAMGEGRQSNNPWLQELPDPVTRICWDNFASVSVLQAKENGLSDGDLIDLGGVIIPVHLQPGQAYGTISAALGYGRRICGIVGEGVGGDVWKLLSTKNGNIVYTLKLDQIREDRQRIPFCTGPDPSFNGRTASGS